MIDYDMDKVIEDLNRFWHYDMLLEILEDDLPVWHILTSNKSLDMVMFGSLDKVKQDLALTRGAEQTNSWCFIRVPIEAIKTALAESAMGVEV